MFLSFGNAFVSQKYFGTPKGNKYLNKKAIAVIGVNNLMYSKIRTSSDLFKMFFAPIYL